MFGFLNIFLILFFKDGKMLLNSSVLHLRNRFSKRNSLSSKALIVAVKTFSIESIKVLLVFFYSIVFPNFALRDLQCL